MNGAQEMTCRENTCLNSYPAQSRVQMRHWNVIREAKFHNLQGSIRHAERLELTGLEVFCLRAQSRHFHLCGFLAVTSRESDLWLKTWVIT